MKVLVVNAYGPSNRGDAVLLEECLAEVRSVISDAQLTVLVFEGSDEVRKLHPDIDWCERIGNASGVGARLKTITYMAAAWLAVRLPLPGAHWLLPPAQRRSLAAFRACDLVVSAPGGYIHDTNLAYLVALLHIELGIALGKTVVLAPQSLGPVRSAVGRAVMAHVLRRCDRICTRESYSLQFATQALRLPGERVVPTGDSAFWNTLICTDEAVIDAELSRMGLGREEALLGVTVVGWSFPGNSTPDASYAAYVGALAEALDEISERHNLTPVIFNQVSSDVSTAKAVQARAKRRVVVDERSHPPDVLRGMIARSSLFLGTRFHSCIFAMMAGVPTVAITYLPKTEFIMQDLELGDRCTTIDAFDGARVTQIFAQDLADLPQARARVAAAVNRYQTRFKRLQTVLADIM